MSKRSNQSRLYSKHINKDSADTSDHLKSAARRTRTSNNLYDHLCASDNDDKHLLQLKKHFLFDNSITCTNNAISKAAA